MSHATLSLPSGHTVFAVTLTVAVILVCRGTTSRIIATVVGIVFVAAAMFGLTQVDENTALPIFCAVLFVNGIGMGATMMPAMSAALRSLQRDEVARATSGLNVVQRSGGAMGTAILAVVLTHQIQDNLPQAAASGEQGLGALSSLPPAAQAHALPLIAESFGHTFWWSFAIIAIAFVPAYFLPRDKPVMPEVPAGQPGAAPTAATAIIAD